MNAVTHEEARVIRTKPFFCEFTTYGVLRAIGSEFLELLHRLSASDVVHLKPGMCGEAVITNEKGRVLDVVVVVPHETETLLLISPGKIDELLSWFDKYTIMEDVKYANVTNDFIQYEVAGVDYHHAIEQSPDAWMTMFSDDGIEILHHQSVTGSGVRLLASREKRGRIQEMLHNVDYLSHGARHLWRVINGFPSVGYELTARFNPLESGVASAVSFTKGCYIGQEVIARLDSYNKVQRHLKRLYISPQSEDDSLLPVELKHGNDNAGVLTSLAYDPVESITRGLGLIRLRYEAPGTKLTGVIGDTEYVAEVQE